MGSTDWASIDAALAALRDAGRDLALLHLDRSRAPSDVDVVAPGGPAWLLEARDALAAAGLHPVLVWPYDRRSWSIFLTDLEARRWVQLDSTSDPTGLGRYGLRTEAMLAEASTVDGTRRVDPVDELLYLLVKRAVKGQHGALDRLLADLPAPRDEIERRAEVVLAAHVRPVVRAVLSGVAAPVPRAPLVRGRFRRLRRPVGRWVVGVDVDDDALVDLTERLATGLPQVSFRPGTPRLDEVLRRHWRAGATVTGGAPAGTPITPDVIARGPIEPDRLATLTVLALTQRLDRDRDVRGARRRTTR